AEDGIRDRNVTGVQTCALPISGATTARFVDPSARSPSTEIISASLSTELTATAPLYVAGTSLTKPPPPPGLDVPATITTPSRTASATTVSHDGDPPPTTEMLMTSAP